MPQIRKNPPNNAAEEIKMLASTGFSKVGVAAHFCIAVTTLERWLEQNERLQRAFDEGREQERLALHNALYKACVEKGNIVAGIFLLKARFGYREGDQSDTSNRVAITFNLPGAMTPEDYKLAKIVSRSRKELADGDTTA